ncbi:hypothetical protein B0I35DRAFT_420389 [Stachybotrys elegans]|uniref:Uncharacterized protein n=1 Tax=Stachybotrys elegans TaxID=80388 RepID=A0A8K0T475_9HYPO|nr:hypothetical protein B0I35DRAFT_420389 [Stachybotrys elegans]
MQHCRAVRSVRCGVPFFQLVNQLITYLRPLSADMERWVVPSRWKPVACRHREEPTMTCNKADLMAGANYSATKLGKRGWKMGWDGCTKNRRLNEDLGGNWWLKLPWGCGTCRSSAAGHMLRKWTDRYPFASPACTPACTVLLSTGCSSWIGTLGRVGLDRLDADGLHVDGFETDYPSHGEGRSEIRRCARSGWGISKVKEF